MESGQPILIRVRTLDIGLLQAGASMKGEFEQRLRQVIEEVQSSPKPIILFIDEAQRINDIGVNLKILYDSFPDLRIIVVSARRAVAR